MQNSLESRALDIKEGIVEAKSLIIIYEHVESYPFSIIFRGVCVRWIFARLVYILFSDVNTQFSDGGMTCIFQVCITYFK